MAVSTVNFTSCTTCIDIKGEVGDIGDEVGATGVGHLGCGNQEEHPFDAPCFACFQRWATNVKIIKERLIGVFLYRQRDVEDQPA